MADKIPVFSNFGKATNDFFTKGFPLTHKIELTTKAENGLTFVSSAEKKERKDGTQYILGKVEAKYKCCEGKSSFEATGSVDSDNVIKGDFSLTHASLPGFKFLLKPQTGKSQEIVGGFEFQNPHLSASSSILYKRVGDVIFTGTLVGGYNKISIGLESIYAFSREQGNKTPAGLDSLKGLFNYKTRTLDASLYVRQQWHLDAEKKDDSKPVPNSRLTVGGFIENKPTEKTTLHTTLELDPAKLLSEVLTCTIGSQYKVDDQTTTQAKFNTEGKLTLHVSKDLTPHLRGTLTSEFNALNLAGNEHKIAVGVFYKA